MRRANVHNATKLLTDNTKIDSLSLTEKRLQQLKQKYPPRGNANPEVLLLDKPGEVYPIKFKRKCKTGKVAGSGLDTECLERLFTSTQIRDRTTEIRNTIFDVIKNCALQNLACCLIPLETNPRMRPIGVGNLSQRIAGKVIVTQEKDEIITSVRTLQVFTGHEARCESLIISCIRFMKKNQVKQSYW